MDTLRVIHLTAILSACPGDECKAVLKAELEALDKYDLPLQQALRQSNSLGSSPFKVMLLSLAEEADGLRLKVGVFFTGTITGCACSDDPTPENEINEYCELLLHIDKQSAQATVALLPD